MVDCTSRKDFIASVAAFAATGLVARAAAPVNGAEYRLAELPEEWSLQLKRGGTIRFLLEENATTGFQWEARYAANECTLTLEHRASANTNLVGAPGRVAVTIAKNPDVQSPTLIEFLYRRNWEKDAPPAHRIRLVLYTIPGEVPDFNYPKSRILDYLLTEAKRRGVTLTDWHVHIRGGLSVEMALTRQKKTGIVQGALENHGREWEIFDNARLQAFADNAHRIALQQGMRLPVGVQVNDRDWFKQIDAQTRAKLDYVLADTMIMGKLANGRDRRLWLVKSLAELGDPNRWMEDYMAMNLQILSEPISILANPTYLPAPLNQLADELWTPSRMEQIIACAVKRGIALEIQAESPYPSPKFLRLAKQMGAKFSFGTNNYDAVPKNLSRWLEALVWLDLGPKDFWLPR